MKISMTSNFVAISILLGVILTHKFGILVWTAKEMMGLIILMIVFL